ncbi:MAG TPA: class I SAM-dependent rRNA methyltransferase [Rhizomicrobium sp.]|jgi:23S rRNA (cytosine1962-C5)-methyltransferase|nr:class I SAM-dependent rRNA methyltransferase [Rhizomicrobium sp.]
MKYPLIRLKPKEGRRMRAGAPWIFSNEVAMTPNTKALAAGSLVNIASDNGQEFGTGYFNSKSLIAVRMLCAAPDADIDRDYFAQKLSRALERRNDFYDKPFYRLVHAEADGLPGVTIDRFGDVCVVQMTTAGMEALQAPFLKALDQVVAPTHVLLRNDTPSRALEGMAGESHWAKGEPLARIAVEENGARYFADLASGQKTGWYYDQRDNRAFMASLAKGKSVLDAYCYAGGFAIAAARAGAKEAIGLDSSQPALALAGESAAANGVAQCKFVKTDVFEELERLSAAGEKFGIVIADPPPFVRAKKDLESGARAYRKLARLAASVTAPGGYLFIASCSHNMPLERFASECAIGVGRADRSGAVVRQAGAPPDHPVHPMLPETAYLKALVYALD